MAKIRIGAVGANVAGWANPHLQAIASLPQFEITATCTTKMESARESAEAFGASLAFDDYREMVKSDDVDAVLVCLQAPRHVGPTTAALEAGKHVYTEWPFGKDLAEAEQMAALAREKGVRTMVGIQARSSPIYLRLKELIDEGYVGDLLAAKVSWMANETDFSRVQSRVGQGVEEPARGRRQRAHHRVRSRHRPVLRGGRRVHGAGGHSGDPGQDVERHRHGGHHRGHRSGQHPGQRPRPRSGAVVTAQVAWLPGYNYSSDYRAEIYGTKGSLLVTSSQKSLIGAMEIFGSRDGSTLTKIDIPERLDRVGDLVEDKGGVVFYLAQAYARFAEAIATGQRMEPDFDSGVTRRRLIDAIYAASDTGQVQKL